MIFKVNDKVSFIDVDRYSGTGILQTYSERTDKWLISLRTMFHHSTKTSAPYKTWWVPTAELVRVKPTSYKELFLRKVTL